MKIQLPPMLITPKQNIVMLGPTGVGKTYLIRHIAKLIGVPFVKADATRFSETGYVGANVDDLIRELVTQAEDNLELAQYGIIYLDEADKIATPPNIIGRDVSGRGVQIGLLKLMEETEVDLRAGNDVASQMRAAMEFQKSGKVEKEVINTRHILFIISGAFTWYNRYYQETHASKQNRLQCPNYQPNRRDGTVSRERHTERLHRLRL